MSPFRLLKESELRSLERKAMQAGRDWSSRWGLHGDFSWTADAAEAPSGAEPGHRITVEFADAVQCMLDIPSGMAGRLASLALGHGAQQESDHAVAVRLAHSCLSDWLAAFTSETELRLQPDAVPPVMDVRGSGAARLACQVEGKTLFTAILPLPLLRRAGVVDAKGAAAPAAEMVRRSVAALPASVRLGATLSDTELTIKDLREISVGDVLILNHPLDAPLWLRIGGVTAGRAYPGVQAGRLGAELSK